MAQHVDLGEHINFRDYFSEHVVGLKGSGDQLTGLCPLHGDTTDSFSVNVATGLWFCHAEGIGGNIVDFHAKLNSTTTKEAYKDLCRLYDIPGRSAGGSGEMKGSGNKVKKAAPKKKPDPPKKRPTIPDEVWEKWGQLTEDWVEYLKDECGWLREAIKSLDIRLDDHYLSKDGEKAFRQRKRSDYLCIPVRDSAGNLINIRRWLPPGPRAEHEEAYRKAKAEGKNPRPVIKILSIKAGYGGDAMIPSPKVAAESGKHSYIVEGERDMILARSLGLNAYTRTGKKHEWTEEEKNAFKGHHVILCFDADQAGEKFAYATAKALYGYSYAAYQVDWPDEMGRQKDGKWPAKGGKDLTDFFLKLGKTLDDFKRLYKREIIIGPIPDEEGKPSSHPQKREPAPSIAATLKRATEINKRHAVVRIGGSVRVMSEDPHPVTKKTAINFLTIGDFRAFYANEKVLDPETKKFTGIGNIWLNWSGRRQYEGLVFEPGQTSVEGYYNLYRGLTCEPAKGDWSLFRGLIEEVIADGKPSRAKYILAWMARIVQDPGGERPGVSIVMRGRQGTGKGTFANILGSLFGPHYLQFAQAEQVLGRFNSHLKEALVVFVDEGFWAGNKQAEGVIKNMITEPEINIEQKGKDIFTIRNHINMLVASNNSWVIPAGLEERRFFVIDVSEKKIQNNDYFAAIYKQMENGGREALLYDLLHLDISRINLRKFERTEGLLDQILASMNSLHKFWYQTLNDGTLDPNYGFWSGEAPLGVLHIHYKNFCADMSDRYPLTRDQFSREIGKLCKGIRRQRRRIKSDEYDGVEKDRRITILFFPSLDDCRRQFEDLVRMTISWDDEDEIPQWMSVNGTPGLGTTGAGNWDRLGQPNMIPN